MITMVIAIFAVCWLPIQVSQICRIKTEEKAKVVFTVWGTELYYPPGRFEEKDEYDNVYLAEWMLWKMDDHPVHTLPNHHPTKLGCILTKTLVQIILAAKWLVRHSSTRPTTNRDDFCLLFCICPSSMRLAHAACFLWSLKPGVCVETSVLSPHSKVGVLHTSGSICFRILKLGVYRKTRFRIKLILSRFEPFDCSGSRFSRNLRVFISLRIVPEILERCALLECCSARTVFLRMLVALSDRLPRVRLQSSFWSKTLSCHKSSASFSPREKL